MIAKGFRHNKIGILISSCQILDSSVLGLIFQRKRSVEGAITFNCQFKGNHKNVGIINHVPDNYFFIK